MVECIFMRKVVGVQVENVVDGIGSGNYVDSRRNQTERIINGLSNVRIVILFVSSSTSVGVRAELVTEKF